MINVKELRIGNYVKWDDESNEVVKIEGIGLDDIFEYYISFIGGSAVIGEFEPIPLTEQWLIDFGFVNDNDDGRNFIKINDDLLRLKVREVLNGFIFVLGNYLIVPIPNVHDLQNLYWCLCKKELKILH